MILFAERSTVVALVEASRALDAATHAEDRRLREHWRARAEAEIMAAHQPRIIAKTVEPASDG